MQCYFFHLHLFHVSRTTHVRTCWSAQSCAWSSLPLALIDCETWMLTLVRRLKTISKKLSPSEYFSTTDCGTRWEASHPTIISGYALKIETGLLYIHLCRVAIKGSCNCSDYNCFLWGFKLYLCLGFSTGQTVESFCFWSQPKVDIQGNYSCVNLLLEFCWF